MNAIATSLLQAPPGIAVLTPQPFHILTVHAAGSFEQRVDFDGHRYRRRLTPGVVDFIPADAPARFHDADANSVLALMIPTELLSRAQDELVRVERPPHATFGIADPQLGNLAWTLHGSGAAESVLYRDCIGIEIVRRILLPQACAVAERDTSLGSRRARRVLDFIEDRLDQPLEIKDLAREAGIGTTTFKRAFRHSIGMPVHQYVVRRRSERARLLLLRGNLAPSQVALEVGFSHQTHMARWLRRLFGTLPSDLVQGNRAPTAKG